MDPILTAATELGFGETAGLSIGPEVSGVLPVDDYCRERKYWIDERGRKRRLSCTLGDAVNASIGQGFVTVTPYQLGLAYARIASGRRIEPRIVRRVVAHDTREVVSYTDENPPKLNFKREHLDLVREGLLQVVNDPKGTAYSAFYNAKDGAGAARLRRSGAHRRRKNRHRSGARSSGTRTDAPSQRWRTRGGITPGLRATRR